MTRGESTCRVQDPCELSSAASECRRQLYLCPASVFSTLQQTQADRHGWFKAGNILTADGGQTQLNFVTVL